jgi:YebC/PmpR family DNA-binding regulatory protein|tara:strand:+ start:292 stop:1038 length:747 start_codon:yes stop_codon:yes gene_type:complete
MAGHSKWANIQHRKGRQDKKRGKLFTKLIREITVAAKIGGGDLSSNPRLRSAIDNAKSQSMPKDNIERAIAKGTGGDDGTTLEEVIYEGYGPGGVAILIECMTDNRNRTVAEVRHALTKHGGNLGTEGSVAYLFEQIGYISITKSSDPESLIEVAIESGAEDIEINDDGSVEIETKPQDLIDVKESIVDSGEDVDINQLIMKASTEVLVEQKHAESMMKLMDTLDDLDDVQKVHSNIDFSDEFLSAAI